MAEKKKKRFVLTGATGLLGSNLLFEIIKQHLDDLSAVEVIILGRGKNNLDIEQRVREIILNEGLSYLGISEDVILKNASLFGETIKCVHLDLNEKNLSVSEDDLTVLSSDPIDVVFHVAALTDFRSSEETINSLRRINVRGTESILKLFSSLDVKQFAYVGSAYSCGKSKGNILPDFISLEQDFRNPYEATKLEAEILVRTFSRETGIPCKYFRSSTICGRLIEKEIGLVNKFDVFYAWAAFFLRAKLKHIKKTEDIFNESVHMDARITYNPKSGLNVVPADYAAKVMYQVCTRDSSEGSYHLVNDAETLHSEYIPIMLEALNIKGVIWSKNLPEDMNRLENLYYKTVGKIYTPYITSEPILFSTKNLEGILSETGLVCPEVDKENFRALMDYAIINNFGIPRVKVKTLENVVRG